MSRTSTVHLYPKSKPINGGTYKLGFVGITDKFDILSLNSAKRQGIGGRYHSRQCAVRYSINELLDQYEPKSIVLYASAVNNPGLCIGRLEPEKQRLAQNISINISDKQVGDYHRLADAFVSQKEVYSWSYERGRSSFSPPFKIYTDGSSRPHHHTASSSVGYVILDSDNNVVYISGESVSKELDYLESEFMAVKTAVSKINKINPTAKIDVYADNETVTRAIQQKEYPSRVSNIAESVISILRTSENYGVQNINRDYNKLADALATIGHDYKVSLMEPESSRGIKRSRKKTSTKYSIK